MQLSKKRPKHKQQITGQKDTKTLAELQWLNCLAVFERDN